MDDCFACPTCGGTVFNNLADGILRCKAKQLGGEVGCGWQGPLLGCVLAEEAQADGWVRIAQRYATTLGRIQAEINACNTEILNRKAINRKATNIKGTL